MNIIESCGISVLCDRDDCDYYGIRDIENLFDEASEEDYYKPIFVKSSHKGNYKHERDTGETRIYYVWSDNMSIMQSENRNAIIGKFFNSFT